MGNPVLETLRRLETLIREQNLDRSAILNPRDLAAKSALPEHTVRCLLRGKNPPADTVNDRVQARIKALSDAHLARTGKPMSDLAGSLHRQLGISAFWARQVCSGEKTPSVELLHGLVEFFGVKGNGLAFFTAPAPEALNRVLLDILAKHQPASERTESVPDPLAPAQESFDDVRSVRLRQARDLPPEHWKVLNATLTALLSLDEHEGDQ
ncbi:hypothetical protein IM697_18640 [Streptomyces ferrugineus]|uniref:Uncharacterized protein n=1 Tax=Streptomyces ferrugineus TaxID=1413221 RepID=A0A7M2SV68_9ACTN|nr:hypothetical protein [Streptomyces ferrugineus]QOV40240.1 hypothetical protein IM697_18640 [Streptomyces ferrugineus]